MTFKEKMASRKFCMAMYLLGFATLGLLFSALSTLVVGSPVILLSGGEFVSLCTFVYGLYAGSNVMQKKLTGVKDE